MLKIIQCFGDEAQIPGFTPPRPFLNELLAEPTLGEPFQGDSFLDFSPRETPSQVLCPFHLVSSLSIIELQEIFVYFGYESLVNTYVDSGPCLEAGGVCEDSGRR